jgi:hypothetical protein
MLPWSENSIKYYECSLASATQHAMCIFPAQHYIPICGLPRSTIYFSHYLINSTIFGGKKLSNLNVCLIFSTDLSETFLSLKRIQRDMIINVYRSSCKVPVILVRLYRNLIFWIFRKILKYQNSWKSTHTGRETDERKDWQKRQDDVSSKFSQFCERAQKWTRLHHSWVAITSTS